MEISGAKVQRAIARGVSVYQGDIDEGLADYPDQAFDYVILSQTLQETRASAARCCARCCAWAAARSWRFRISGTGRVRLSMLLSGRAPKTPLFPYEWYDSPNIHFLTRGRFSERSDDEQLTVERRFFLAGHRSLSSLPNLRAEVAVYLVRR